MNLKHPVSFLAGNYEKDRFYRMAEGLEDVKEGGARCFKCYALRLRETAQMAKKPVMIILRPHFLSVL